MHPLDSHMLRPDRKADLYACLTDDGAIILDLTAERYYTLDMRDVDQPMDAVFFHSREVNLHPGSNDLESLSCVEATPAPLGTSAACLLALLRAIIYVTVTRKLFGTRAVIQHLRRLKRRRARSLSTEAPHTLPCITHAFQRFRPFFYTARDHCLLDAIILATYLLYLGSDSRFVVAVRTQPFQAHAWAQSGHYLVDDCLEKIQLFTPILVV